jgi:hypothetical protein
MKIDLRKPKKNEVDLLVSVNPTSNRKVSEWISSVFSNEDAGKYINVLGDNRDSFNRIFGKPNKTMQLNRKFNVYYFLVDNVWFSVLTAKEIGTSIEVLVDSSMRNRDTNYISDRYIELFGYISRKIS